MASTSKVYFRYGTRAAYDALVTKDAKSLYFLLDTNELYRGDVPIGTSHYYTGSIDTTKTTAQNIALALNGNTPVANDLLVLTDNQRNTQDLYVYSDNDWHHLNAHIRSESIIFQNGDTLDEKLATLQTSINFNENVLELDSDILSLKDYGKKYYKYFAETEAEGEVGDPNYVPAVPAHYELVTVNTEHPWPNGLTPKISNDGTLGWYEPNLSTLEGIQDLVESLQTSVGNLTELESRVESLETIVGTIGTEQELDPVSGEITIPATESTGLIARVENIEDTINNLSTGVYGIQVNEVTLEINNGVVNIPIFSDMNAGVVPALSTEVGTLEEEEKGNYFLNANAEWNNPIGNLTFNSQTYNTVKEYVDARVDDSTLKWEIIP